MQRGFASPKQNSSPPASERNEFQFGKKKRSRKVFQLNQQHAGDTLARSNNDQGSHRRLQFLDSVLLQHHEPDSTHPAKLRQFCLIKHRPCQIWS